MPKRLPELSLPDLLSRTGRPGAALRTDRRPQALLMRAGHGISARDPHRPDRVQFVRVEQRLALQRAWPLVATEAMLGNGLRYNEANALRLRVAINHLLESDPSPCSS